MEIEKFKQLVYAKGFDGQLTQKLLGIAGSSMAEEMILEDLLTLIKEQYEYLPEPVEPDTSDNCEDCDIGVDAERARERAVREKDLYEKMHKDLKRDISIILDGYSDFSDTAVVTLRDQIERRCLKKLESTGDTGIGITEPMHLMHMKCKCGKELYIEGKDWTIDFQGGPVIFKCPCGQTVTLPGPEPVSLCTDCKATVCKTCDRPVCPECEDDDPLDPSCLLCERNRPHA